MKTGRLHTRHDPELLRKIHEIAEKQGTTVTAYIDACFRAIVRQDAADKTDEELGVDQA